MFNQVRITIEAPTGHGKTTLGNVLESYIRANWPKKSIARFPDVDYDAKLVHSNCDVIIVEKNQRE